MKSKITIHTSPNFKPCIKVSEARYTSTLPEDEDVRDRLVSGFRGLLTAKSSTAHLYSEGDENEYFISPVEDELAYVEGLIMNKYLGDARSREQLLKIANLITNHLTMETTTTESGFNGLNIDGK